MDNFQKKWIPGQKTAFLTRNSAFFYATPMKPPFLWLGQSRLNGMTTPPYPEGTLDTFGFLVGGRLATRRAVSWPLLPKVALLGSKNAVFLARNHFFVVSLKINCYNHNFILYGRKCIYWSQSICCDICSVSFHSSCNICSISLFSLSRLPLSLHL